jgi:hypothetical protein
MRAPASRAARYAPGDSSFARASTAPPAAAPATGCAVTVSGESVPSEPNTATAPPAASPAAPSAIAARRFMRARAREQDGC